MKVLSLLKQSHWNHYLSYHVPMTSRYDHVYSINIIKSTVASPSFHSFIIITMLVVALSSRIALSLIVTNSQYSWDSQSSELNPMIPNGCLVTNIHLVKYDRERVYNIFIALFTGQWVWNAQLAKFRSCFNLHTQLPCFEHDLTWPQIS